MDEKDHGGKQLRLTELTEEARYDGERNREARAQLTVHHPATQEPRLGEQRHGRCPQCGARLQERSVQGLTMLACASCQGIWLNKDKIPILAHPSGSGAWFETFLRGLGWWRPFHCD